MKQLLFFSSVFALCAWALVSCAPTPPAPTPIPTASPTPNPCAADRLPMNAGRVHELTRAYDDAYQLASNTPRDQLAPQVAELQRIRRLAQDQAIPVCLVELKKRQLAYMNEGVDTMLLFLRGADQGAIQQGMAATQQQHTAYVAELAKLVGATVVPPTATTPP